MIENDKNDRERYVYMDMGMVVFGESRVGCPRFP